MEKAESITIKGCVDFNDDPDIVVRTNIHMKLYFTEGRILLRESSQGESSGLRVRLEGSFKPIMMHIRFWLMHIHFRLMRIHFASVYS